jgi:DNA replication protein DnaC
MEQTPCKRCGGTGFIIVEHEDISGASRCSCANDDRAALLEVSSGLPPAYEKSSFEKFKCFGNANLKGILHMVSKWSREFMPGTPRNGLLLVGDTGTGKTHLATAALREILAKNIDGRFFDYQALLDSIRAGYDPTSNQSNKEVYKAALETEVILLDDLGAHRVTDWVEDTVTSIGSVSIAGIRRLAPWVALRAKSLLQA